MTLVGHLFSKQWFNFYIDILLNEFLAIFYYMYTPCCIAVAAMVKYST